MMKLLNRHATGATTSLYASKLLNHHATGATTSLYASPERAEHMNDKDKERARERAAVVFAVRSGRITAEEGARRLGVSRKTYYEWERRAIEALTGALEDKAPGRPAAPQDEEKERLQKEIAELKNKLFVAEKTVEVRDMLHAYELHNAHAKKSAGKEKKQKQRKKP